MKKLIELLDKSRIVSLATVDWEGNPQSRVVMVMSLKEDRLHFCTGSFKKMYIQMNANPNVAISLMNEKGLAVRVNGKVEFTDDIDLKIDILNKHPEVAAIYKNADNKEFVTFKIVSGWAQIFDLSKGLSGIEEFKF